VSSVPPNPPSRPRVDPFNFVLVFMYPPTTFARVKFPSVLFSVPMAVTMSDIARDLDVSVVTVSKVLRNKGKISEQTRQRVLRRSRELNYQPNLIARSLVTRRTFTIGLLLPDFTHPFFAQIAKSVAQTMRSKGYHVLISYFEEDPAIELSEGQALLSRHVDGLILASAQSDGRCEFFKHIRGRNTPLVLIDRAVPQVRASFVGVDHTGIGRMATEHLIAQGCRHIAHLRGPDVGIANDRLNGYCLTLQKNGFRVLPDYIVEAGFQSESGYDAMRGLLQTTVRIDGVFCYNDPIAVGAMKAIREAGRKVPQDIAVVGAGNVNYSDILAIPLTTIDQEPDEIGRVASRILLEQIESKKSPKPRRVLVPHRLLIRESTEHRRAKGTKLRSREGADGVGPNPHKNHHP
jgi:LacI family transcriptional regulator